MPLSLAFRFPAGRYHATPFGHHVNEGLIEWPPSPWRILRALISVGYTSGVWNSGGPPPAACNLIEMLSGELPSYYLPSAVGAHSRHYMPIGVLDSKTKIEKTTLVFDTWARIDDEEMTVTWKDVRLERDEASILEDLVQCLNYLGRSESWVECRVMEAGEEAPETNCFPERVREIPGLGWEQVALLAPTSVSEFSAWRAEQIDKALAELPLPEGRKPPATLRRKRDKATEPYPEDLLDDTSALQTRLDLLKATEPYPEDLLDCLQKNTNWWRHHGWSQPPGSRRVFYWRPSDVIAVGAPKPKRTSAPEQRIQAMLLSLTNASRNDRALPPVTRTLAQADLVHRALVNIATKYGTPPPELTGRDKNRSPLRGPHEHAHINPLDLDGDGHLDHILIWARMGLGANAQSAIRALRKTFTKGDIEPLRLALAATKDLCDLTRRIHDESGFIAAIAAHGSAWQSVTPFVPPRHLKARGKNALEGQIRAELHSRGFPEPIMVHPFVPTHVRQSSSDPSGGSNVRGRHADWSRFRHFVLSRKRGPAPPLACGFAIRLEFDQPVYGPIALGYGSHFGLGLFEGCAVGDRSPLGLFR